MMQPIVTKDDSLARGIETAGGALGDVMKVYANRKYESDKRARDGTILGNLLNTIGPDSSYTEIVGGLNSLAASGASQEAQKQAADLYMPLLKSRADTGSMTNMARQMGIGNPTAASGSSGYRQYEMPENNMQSMTQQNVMPQGLQPSQAQMNAPFYQEQRTQQSKRSPIETINTAKQALRNPPSTDMQTAPNLPSNEDIIALGAFGGNKGVKVADLVLKQRGMDQQKFESDRTYHAQQANKAIDNARTIRDSLLPKENALNLMRAAIETGETGPLSMANIAKRLDIPELMNAAGTELSQAGKEFFLGNMARISAKAQNQWMEQRLASLMANVGDPKINALMKQTILESEYELNKAYLKAFDEIKAEDMKEFNYPRNDIEERAYKRSQEESKNILNKASFKTRELYEEEKGTSWIESQAEKKVKPPKGTILSAKMAKAFGNQYGGDMKKVLSNAEKLGYRIPTKEEVTQWQQ